MTRNKVDYLCDHYEDVNFGAFIEIDKFLHDLFIIADTLNEEMK